MINFLIVAKQCLSFVFTLLIFILILKGQMLPEEFGNVLTYGFHSFNPNSSLGLKVTEFSENYVRKRLDWCVPPTGENPIIQECQRKTLLYSTDNRLPLFYDDLVRDSLGREYGVTSLFRLGTVYHIILTWRRNMLQYTHNLTIAEYPKDNLHVYTHKCSVRNLNVTSIKHDHYNIIYNDHRNLHLGESYFKHFSSKVNVDTVIDNEYSSSRPVGEVTDNLLNKFDKAHSPDIDNHAEDEWTYENEGSGNHGDRLGLLQKGWPRFSVMTFNIWNMNPVSGIPGQYTRRMKRLKQVILNSDVDILAVQEVRYEQQHGEELGPCQIHTLSSWLPQYQYVYQPGQMQPNTPYDGKTEEGVAILSRYPILNHNTHKLFINRSNSADTHQRVVLHAEVFIPRIGKVHVFTTHLSLSHEAREESVRQIHHMLASVQGPAILLGDFNAEPHEQAMRYLTGVKKDKSLRLVDLWIHVHNHTDKGHTFNALEKKLTKRIDYIFFRNGTNCCKIEYCSVLDDGLRGLKAASDHLPVKTEFSCPSQHKHKQGDQSRS